MLDAAAERGANAIAALQLLDGAGYRDFLWVELLPPLDSLHDEPGFQAVITSMRDDVARQRTGVLSAEWLPPELCVVDVEPTCQ